MRANKQEAEVIGEIQDTGPRTGRGRAVVTVQPVSRARKLTLRWGNFQFLHPTRIYLQEKTARETRP